MSYVFVLHVAPWLGHSFKDVSMPAHLWYPLLHIAMHWSLGWPAKIAQNNNCNKHSQLSRWLFDYPPYICHLWVSPLKDLTILIYTINFNNTSWLFNFVKHTPVWTQNSVFHINENSIKHLEYKHYSVLIGAVNYFMFVLFVWLCHVYCAV